MPWHARDLARVVVHPSTDGSFVQASRGNSIANDVRVLAIDPALRNTGYAVLEGGGRDVRALVYDVIRNPSSLPPSRCLVRIRDTLADVIRQYEPECCAVESVIYVQSYKTAITLGAARGAAILAAAEHGLDIFEYPPRRVKQAVVGRGGADKQQVAFMIRALVGLTETPPADAADALAVGLTHLQNTRKDATMPPGGGGTRI